MPLLLCLAFASSSLPVGAVNPPAKWFFDLPAGPASTSLKLFISQSGVQLLYVPEEVSGVVTNAVKGEFTAREAVKQLLANTGLVAIETANGAFAVNRAPVPNG